MKVTLVASTRLETQYPEGPPYIIDEWLPRDGRRNDPDWSVDYTSEADVLEEFAGRSCYLSWDRPNVKTAENSDYMAHILEVGHESILEHATASFYVEGVTRTLTHELVRHRHLSPSQQSQRYVDESMAEFTVPGDLADLSHDDPEIVRLMRQVSDHHVASRILYGKIDDALKKRGLSTKQARGAARSVLPGNVHTSLVISGNMRAWRYFLRKRWHVAAEREIRELAGIILGELRSIAPNTFQDIPEVPFGSENDSATGTS